MLYYDIVILSLGVILVYDIVPFPLYVKLDNYIVTSLAMLDDGIIPLPLYVMFDYCMYLSP